MTRAADSPVGTKILGGARAAASGFSLIEVLVGMVIGLIGVLVMFQLLTVSQAQRRTTSSSGDAQQNGMIALYLLEHDVRQAGYGIKSLAAPCKSPPISVSGSAGTHAITVMYSNSAVGNVTQESCTTANTIYRRYSVAADGAKAGLRLEELGIDGVVTATRQQAADIVALTAELLPTATAPTSLRIAVAARSPLREKPDAATGLCATTTSLLPTWPGGPQVTPPEDDSGVAGSWKCYRYKTFYTNVPLRSLIW